MPARARERSAAGLVAFLLVRGRSIDPPGGGAEEAAGGGCPGSGELTTPVNRHII